MEIALVFLIMDVLDLLVVHLDNYQYYLFHFQFLVGFLQMIVVIQVIIDIFLE